MIRLRNYNSFVCCLFICLLILHLSEHHLKFITDLDLRGVHFSLLIGFFLPSFPKLIRFKDHHDEVTRKNLKKIKKHLVCGVIFEIKP